MNEATRKSTFKAELLAPTGAGKGAPWAFLILPKSASNRLPRRGRTTVSGTLNGHAFQAMLEPDGQLSHWLKVSEALRKAAGVQVGDKVAVKIDPVAQEPEPELPSDLRDALAACPAARAVWDDTTTLARVDWIHWIESAKQAKTRQKRVNEACDKLGGGQRRVCCFDPSGFYSKGLCAPRAAEPDA
jgi:hypothetical protein